MDSFLLLITLLFVAAVLLPPWTWARRASALARRTHVPAFSAVRADCLNCPPEVTAGGERYRRVVLTRRGTCPTCDSRAVEVRGNTEHARLAARDALLSTDEAKRRLREAARGRRSA
jgi:hypothetical protein